MIITLLRQRPIAHKFDLQIMTATVGLPSLDLYLLSQLFLAVLAVVGWFKSFPKLQLSKYT